MGLQEMLSSSLDGTPLGRTVPVLAEAAASGNLRLLQSFLGPAYRGLFLQVGKHNPHTELNVEHPVHVDWGYQRDVPAMQRLYEAAKSGQWNGSKDIDWSRDVDPYNPEKPLIPENFHPAAGLRLWRKMSATERQEQLHAITAWFLSQFLHGEQGALYAACQITQAVPWVEAKLLGSTQVVDEGRHVEVFHTYLTKKLDKIYQINDNLYVVIDALMSDSRWDVKFLGMQIMIEGLALGAFGMMRKLTGEPVLKDLLRYVIGDEARHVHYGVLGLRKFYKEQATDRERREREEWALEVSLLLRNRFLCHEIYDEFYAHAMTRAEWDRLVLESEVMRSFRQTMFRRIIPNLKEIGLLSERVQPRYEALGLLGYQTEKAAPDLTAADLLADGHEGENGHAGGSADEESSK